MSVYVRMAAAPFNLGSLLSWMSSSEGKDKKKSTLYIEKCFQSDSQKPYPLIPGQSRIGGLQGQRSTPKGVELLPHPHLSHEDLVVTELFVQNVGDRVTW